ncbi:MAG TPA: hypothetical protein VE978_14565 [Chitinophagales bacterium]|nr:hypothetical protein [Chitinophagales bacterium]
MKNKLFFLISMLSYKGNITKNKNHIKQSLLNFVEEAGAWLLLGGFLMGIVWIAGILLGTN